jgi:hypothetical protein
MSVLGGSGGFRAPGAAKGGPPSPKRDRLDRAESAGVALIRAPDPTNCFGERVAG